MSIDKKRLLELITQDKVLKYNNKQRVLPNTSTSDDEFVSSQLNDTLGQSKNSISNYTLEKTIPFVLWNDSWNNYGVFGLKSNEKKQYWRYSGGQIVHVDFGCGNIKTELSFPHPAIILYNFAQTAIVIPITTDDKKTAFDDEIENVIIKVKSKENSIPNDSIINIHQLKAIHKERIINKLKYNVKKYIVDDQEIKRLNSRIDIESFKTNMSLWECIQLKYALMFNRTLYDEKIKLFKEHSHLIQHINDIEGMLVNLEKNNSDYINEIRLKIEEIKKIALTSEMKRV